MDKKEIPCFKLKINPEDKTGIAAISLVDDPAIQSNWIAFSKEKNIVKLNLSSHNFKAVEGEKQVIRGAVMIPDLPIVRVSDTGQQFYVQFDKETVYQMVKKYFRQKRVDSVNMMHDANAMASGVYLIESFIVDKASGIPTPKAFDEHPDGTWFVTMAVDNPEIWNGFIKTGQFKGFSLEGDFIQEPYTELSEKEINKLIEAIK